MTEREEIEPQDGDKRYIRRDKAGHFTEDQVDEGRSLSADARHSSETRATEGDGDRGDEKP